MAFVRIPNIEGRVFVPDPVTASQKKHKCRDCFACQLCGDSRCRLCLSGTNCADRSEGSQPRSIRHAVKSREEVVNDAAPSELQDP